MRFDPIGKLSNLLTTSHCLLHHTISSAHLNLLHHHLASVSVHLSLLHHRNRIITITTTNFTEVGGRYYNDFVQLVEQAGMDEGGGEMVGEQIEMVGNGAQTKGAEDMV
ncbi:hypothetical protein POM88_033220 [Heracleum sosnowskyi]|uniref:Uncharacterized protein n=1 Tax=Heracleum sosnowskyi TaxID=360622 RepID=A0AAD8MLD2_9APIA|nr:hypothetical protein POM88_033220 [Heracleum sosnowskyi]